MKSKKLCIYRAVVLNLFWLATHFSQENFAHRLRNTVIESDIIFFIGVFLLVLQLKRKYFVFETQILNGLKYKQLMKNSLFNPFSF
jgi:hypothetical protein